MNKIKCIASVALGVVLGLVACKSDHTQPAPQPKEDAIKQPAPTTTLPPTKREELPVRGPMLE